MAKRKISDWISLEHKTLHVEEIVLLLLKYNETKWDERNIKNITIYELREFMHNKETLYLHSKIKQ